MTVSPHSENNETLLATRRFRSRDAARDWQATVSAGARFAFFPSFEPAGQGTANSNAPSGRRPSQAMHQGTPQGTPRETPGRTMGLGHAA